MVLHHDSKLVQNLLLKNELLRNGDKKHEKIRPVLVILGGCMRGVSGAGSAIAFHLLGIADVFDVVVGTSTGAGIGAYFLSGLEQALLGTSIYYQELPPRFIKYFRSPVVDIDFVEELLRDGKKKLDTETIRMARSEFFVGVTDTEDGNHALLDTKTARPDLVSAIKASMAMAGLSSGSVVVNGRQYIDSGGYPFPIREVVHQFKPTDVLLLPNCTRQRGESWVPTLMEKLCGALCMRSVTPKLRELWQLRYQRWRNDLKFFQQLQGVNKGILWAPREVRLLEKNTSRLYTAVQESVQQTLTVFGQSEKKFDLL
ncbi:MAG: patatin-like phospholipase family protein [Patescibacteria group bacterium]